ncbi:LPS assembly lipoprotein LptE [Crocinitomix catalasitica]|uniref:LPS assembly lipoprotein LptE n=1 Tax=Crocinitomix catalasitica TaxID=184607 RepID=UPI0012F94C32|nr:LPS assembly lipoprotein LptE [Crocinitomix catalasitica]
MQKSFKYLILLLIFNLGCVSVKYSMVDGSIDAETFNVDLFEEAAPNAPAGYGATYADFLKDFIISRSKLKLNQTKSDISISGKVTYYNTSPVSVQSNEVAALNSLTVRLDVIVINSKNPDQSFEASFSQFSNYNSSDDLSVVEAELLEDINTKLSQDIINRLTSNW